MEKEVIPEANVYEVGNFSKGCLLEESTNNVTIVASRHDFTNLSIGEESKDSSIRLERKSMFIAKAAEESIATDVTSFLSCDDALVHTEVGDNVELMLEDSKISH